MTLEEIVNNLKSAGQDYGQLFNNNPRMDATKQFGGRAINNLNSAGEGYSQWQKLQDQNFGPNQSVIASSFMHPQKGLSKLADWFTNNVNTAAGLPDPNQQDEASMYAYGPSIDQKAESGLNLAGLLQTGAFASGAAPKSAGGTLGTFVGISAKTAPLDKLGIKNPNLNSGLLDKHLSGQKLTPEEMALYEANGAKMETPQLQRYNLGNANAQGGSPQSRANLLHDSYHGTREFTRHDGTTSSAIDGFDLNRGGVGSGNRDGKLGVFSTNDPYVASEFAERRNNPFVMPLKIRMDNPLQPENYREISDLIDKHTQFKDSYKFPDGSNIRMVDDVINPEAARKELTDKGFDSVYLKNTTMDSIDKKPINQYVSLDPKNIRSRFAAFDPLRKNSSSLLASGLLGSLLLKQMNQESSQQ